MGGEVTSLLLDSVVVIDHFNGIAAATRYLRDHREEIAISVITRAEVLTGFDGEREVLAKAVLAELRHFPVTSDDADLAARLRRQNRWTLPDALQAAIALNRHLKLVTRNNKDFDPTRHSFALIPYTLGPDAG
jgi:predicted nucleic acid-binding protein